MISINIREQRKLLGVRLKPELLTSNEANRTKIQSFHSDKKGESLENYLKENAWDEDRQGITKVYLVKDVKTDEIVFYFALSAGLLYKEIGADDHRLSEVERAIVNLQMDYFQNGNNSITTDEIFSWYEGEAIDKDKVRRIIDKRIRFKLAAKDDPEKSRNCVNIQQVSETFPGIVLTHFCKNAHYAFSEKLAFPMGFYVFWEIVVERILHIAALVGCKYLYLFAADNTEQTPVKILCPEVWEEEDVSEPVPVYKLVEYYKNELKFEDVQDVTILKPYYDFSCFSLIQEIDSLSEHRNAAWIQHSDVKG